MASCSAPTHTDHAYQHGQVVDTPQYVTVATSTTCTMVTFTIRTKVMSTSTWLRYHARTPTAAPPTTAAVGTKRATSTGPDVATKRCRTAIMWTIG